MTHSVSIAKKIEPTRRNELDNGKKNHEITEQNSKYFDDLKANYEANIKKIRKQI